MFGLRSQDKIQPKWRKNKLILWAILFGVLGSSFFYLKQQFNEPTEGAIKQNNSSSVVTEEVTAEKILESDYLTLQYPRRYELQTNPNSSASLESWILIAHQALGLGQASKIAISVASQVSGDIKEDSAYKHAEAFPEYYGISSTAYADEPVKVLERSNPSYERTYLWPHNGYILTISLTSAEKTDKLTSELESILQSVDWL